MHVYYHHNPFSNTNLNEFEVVERKGLGHPDTLADIIANTFSSLYTLYALEHFGGLLNHNVDKVVLAGGTADIGFGEYKQRNPITCYLFGKITNRVGIEYIDVDELFRRSVVKVFDQIFGNGTTENFQIKTIVAANSGIGAEHLHSYYNPESKNDLNQLSQKMTVTDTAYCSVFYGYTLLEKLVIDCENYINGSEFKILYPETGFDVKCLAVRQHNLVNITICIPFLATAVNSFSSYKHRLNDIKHHLELRYSSSPDFIVKLTINSKDTEGTGYLTLFGTALDKGDFGVVGRGNRYEGVICLYRSGGVEASSGKNPFRSTGKVYHAVAYEIAGALYDKFSSSFNVTIVTNNGDILGEPKTIIVSSPCAPQIVNHMLPAITHHVLANMDHLITSLINADHIAEHKNRARHLSNPTQLT